MLVVAVIGPGDSATLANRNSPRTETESAAPGEAEGRRVEVGDIVDADGSLSACGVHWGCE